MVRNDCRWMVRMAAALLFLLLLAACLPFRSTPSPTQDIQAVYTAAAVTMQAQLTMEAGQTAVVQLTQITGQTTPQPVPPKKATDTPPAPTNTAPAPTATVPEPSATPVQPSPTAPPQTLCNRAEWVGDVTAPADTLMPTGSVFTKIWRVRNSGSCTWTPSYALVYTGGNLPPIVMETFLPATVLPGQTIDLSVSLAAPAVPGIYQSVWMFRTATGEMFGVGPSASDPLVARIRTYQTTFNSDFVYDLTANYCSGTWRSGAGVLTCPGSPQDPNGSVLMLESPAMEARRTNEYGLWVRPNQQNNGWISGRMPAYVVQNGDYFLAEIGCLQGSPDCDVIFELDYQIVNGATGQLGRWREIYDGVTTLIDVDLSDLSGRSIYLMLTVYNNDGGSDANAIWLMPRVQQAYQLSTTALTWTRNAYTSRSSCEEIRVSYTSSTTAVAQAFDCRQGSRTLGQIGLTIDQVNQLSTWIERLENTEGEIYSATADRPVTSHVFLRGLGQRVASTEELRAMESFAAQLFNLIVR